MSYTVRITIRSSGTPAVLDRYDKVTTPATGPVEIVDSSFTCETLDDTLSKGHMTLNILGHPFE